MEDINTVVKEPDSEVNELIDLMEMLKQTNQEKYEVLKPVFDRLNLYCDEVSVRFDKDADLFSIPLDAIYSVEYEEDGDTLFILFKKKRNFHSISIGQRVHIIYATKRRYIGIMGHIQRLYNRIGNLIMTYRLKRKLIKYVKRQLNTKH